MLPPTPEAVLPGDPGYLINGVALSTGGYVDLFYSRYLPNAFPTTNPPPPAIRSAFAGLPGAQSGLSQPAIVWGNPFPNAYPAASSAVYDTWTVLYEHDGIDQDSNGIIDQGTNGFDDNNLNGVDDVSERETSPPYPVPLRGIQVRLRIIDTDSRQVRQVTVASDFVPE